MYRFNFCEENTTIWTVWYKNGLGPCFFDTHSSIFLILYMSIFGFVHLYKFRKRGTYVEAQHKPNSKLFTMQITIHAIFIVWPFVELTLNASKLLTMVEFYGRTVLFDLSKSFAWSVCTFGLINERNYVNFIPPTSNRRRNKHSLILIVFWFNFFLIIKSLPLISINGDLWFWKLRNKQEILQLCFFISEYFMAFCLLVLGIKAPGLPTFENWDGLTSDDESTNRENASTFSNIYSKLKILLPYLWPRKSFRLQLRVLACCALLIAGRIVNLYIPIYHKWIVDSLTGTEDHRKLIYRWDLVLVYAFLLLAQGGAMSGGLLATFRSFLWINVQQFTTLEVQIHLYEHLHNLSLRFHLTRKTGEILRVMDRGTNSINQLLSYVLFNITPTIVDILIAIIYFSTSFNVWFGLIVLVTMVLYIVATVCLTEWRTKYRRNMNRLDNEAQAKAVDSLLNYETVKYYNAEEYEVNRYRDALIKYQAAEYLDNASLSLVGLVQNVVITSGLLAGSMLCAWFVVENEHNFTVGSYVLFAGYIIQLYQPLNYLGTYYRTIQKAFVDMENMFQLLKTESEVKDSPDNKPLNVREGRVEFKNVYFSYNSERPILKNISFVVEAGKTVALVGHSGSGKSTIMRLLFRFYKVQSGGIYIDGQDISKVTQKSLRQHIGVVPQDTVLFNDSIKYNIRYGCVTANDKEVYDAANAAEIHDRIASFPEGYETVVGERGLKLSGGEKQRVAIARTILKSPDFVLLDEVEMATSALDTHTERLIQSSLDKICVGRTTMIVAHRLSTIIHADEIIVLKEGEIIERGRHEELLEKDNFYASMWRQQLEKATCRTSSSDENCPNRESAKLNVEDEETNDDNDNDNDV